MIQLLFMSAVALAEEGHGAAHVDPHVIPWSPIFVQFFNLAVLLGFLTYLLRKTVVKHFATRAEEYKEMVSRAEKARTEAEATKAAVAQRLARLEASSVDTVKQAEAEASALKTRMVEEAKQMSVKLEQDAKRTVEVELEKAKADLRRDLLTKALESSKDNLSKNLGSSDQKKLQNEFAEKIQVVGG